MRYCPNTNCPFFVEIGSVAEYDDDVQACYECETALIAGEAPTLVPPAPIGEQKAESDSLQAVVSVETFSEAYAIKGELENMRIAAKIVVSESDEQVSGEQEEYPFFDVLVLPHHVVPAMDVIDTRFFDGDLAGDVADSESVEFADDRFDEDAWVKEGLALEEQAESDSNQVIGIGNNFLLVALIGLLLLVVAALLYGFVAW